MKKASLEKKKKKKKKKNRSFFGDNFQFLQRERLYNKRIL